MANRFIDGLQFLTMGGSFHGKLLDSQMVYIYRCIYIYTHHTLYVLDGMPTINPFFQMRVMWRQDGFPSWR